MSSVQTDGSVCCQCCGEAFLRLSSHLSWNAHCAAFYNSLPSALANGVVDDMHRPADVAYFDKEGDTAAGAGHSREVLGVLQQLTNQLMIITIKGMMKTLV